MERVYSIQYGRLELMNSKIQITYSKYWVVFNIVLTVAWFLWGMIELPAYNKFGSSFQLWMGIALLAAFMVAVYRLFLIFRYNCLQCDRIDGVKLHHQEFQNRYKATFKLGNSSKKIVYMEITTAAVPDLVECFKSHQIEVELV